MPKAWPNSCVMTLWRSKELLQCDGNLSTMCRLDPMSVSASTIASVPLESVFQAKQVMARVLAWLLSNGPKLTVFWPSGNFELHAPALVTLANLLVFPLKTLCTLKVPSANLQLLIPWVMLVAACLMSLVVAETVRPARLAVD